MSSSYNSELNLLHIYRLFVKNWKIIALVCLINALIAGIILMLTPNSYKNTTLFFPASDQLVDRSSVLNSNTPLESTIFGPENIVDRVYNVSTSTTVEDYVIAKQGLIAHYGYDSSSRTAYEKAAKRYAKNIKLRRTEFNSIELTVIDKDVKKASKIAKDIMDKSEEIYHRFLIEFRDSIISNMDMKIAALTSHANQCADSLAKLRDQYHFYGIISPNRTVATIPSTGSVTGSGFEKIQSLELLKEKTLEDIGRLKSLQCDLTLAAAENTYMFHVIEQPHVSYEKAGPFRTIFIAIDACIFVFRNGVNLVIV